LAHAFGSLLARALRVPACKNQTNSLIRGKGGKFDFAHILVLDRLGHDKNYWIVFFWQNILLFQRNMQITKVR